MSSVFIVNGYIHFYWLILGGSIINFFVFFLLISIITHIREGMFTRSISNPEYSLLTSQDISLPPSITASSSQPPSSGDPSSCRSKLLKTSESKKGKDSMRKGEVMVKGKNGNGIERKRTTSDARDGVEYNKKVRKLQDEAAEIEKKAEEDETKKIEEKRDGEEDFADEFIPDPDCNPDIPRQVTFSDISAAAFNIKKGISKTPCTKSLQLSNKYGVELYFKKEYMQVTGSFKERGARFALSRLTAEEKKNGVIAASAGNHALALCYHGNLMGVAVTVVMPVFAPLMKITMCRSYGATVLLKGNNIGKAKDYAMHISREKKLKYINGYDAPDILAGQGTIGLEILEQVSDADAVLVPVGGGGMIAGVAVALKTLKPGILVYGIEAETCPSFTRAYEAGHVITEMAGSTLADGLAVPTVGCNSLATARGLIDKMITVCEESIALSILRLLELEKAVVEGAGGVCLAAILSDKVPELKGKKVVAILSGGNIDTTVLGRAIERGLAVDGRLIRIEVVVSDRPGGIAELSTRIAQAGGSIKDIFHERAWISTDVFSVRVKVVAETRDKEHVLELEKTLKERYTDVRIS